MMLLQMAIRCPLASCAGPIAIWCAILSWPALGLPLTRSSAVLGSSGEMNTLAHAVEPSMDECVVAKLCFYKLGNGDLRAAKAKQLMTCLETGGDKVRSAIAPECAALEPCVTKAGNKEVVKSVLRASSAKLLDQACLNEVDPTTVAAVDENDCQKAISEAKDYTVAANPDWFPHLTMSSPWIDFQQIISNWSDPHTCLPPCNMCHTEQDTNFSLNGYPQPVPESDWTTCQKAINYAKITGIPTTPAMYPNLDATSTWQDIQIDIARSPTSSDCLEPCSTTNLLQSAKTFCVNMLGAQKLKQG